MVSASKIVSRLLVASVFFILSTGCFAEKVDVNPAGYEDLALVGKRNIEGTTSNDLVYKGQTIKKGTRLRISDTWIKRTKVGTNGGYTISGFYDPTKANASQFILPSGTSEVFFAGHILPDRTQKIAVPQRHFIPDER